MIHRLFAIMLSLALLSYGSTWAYGVAADDTPNCASLSDHWTPGKADHGGPACDHCCHAGAHLLAIHQQTSFSVPSERTTFSRPMTSQLVTLASVPPLRPPRV